MPPWVDRGGYRVQPAATAPPGTKKVDSNRLPAAGSSQKLQLLSRGKAMSGAPIMSGTCQLAKPTKAGMIAPKIIRRPCMAVSWLKKAGWKNCRPGWNSSRRMSMAREPANRNMPRLNHR